MDPLMSISLTAAAILLVMALVQLALHRWIRRETVKEEQRQDPRITRPTGRPWVSMSLRTLAPPVAALLWLQGGFVFLRLLLPHVTAGQVPVLWATAVRWTYALALLALLCWLLARTGRVLESFLQWQASRTQASWDDVMLPLAGRTIRRVLPLVGLILGAPALGMSPELEEILSNASSLVLIAVVAFVLMQAVDAAASFVLRQHRIDVRDNLQARAIHTQVLVLKKVALAAIAIFTFASMLMVFDAVRQFGASILASAGIAGIIIGFAAQRSIATLLAGFQIALTQPIRVDDVVIVENEWGRIEDITLTYVVVRIWDLRRLVVPISYFIERPFQNWTRSSADLLAAVTLRVDYAVPLEELRQELTRVLQVSPYWDGKVNVLQVTDAAERSLEVRALASAADASQAWDLRCDVREQLVTFLQRRYPDALPRFRVEAARAADAVTAMG